MRKLFCTLLMLLYSMNGFATDCKVNDPDIVGTYTGGCKNGLAHGKGVAQGRDKYEGMFKNGNLHGQGTYSWSSGNRYEGQWQDGKKHGNGTVTWANGERFVGQWQDGKKHGNGTYTWPSGGRFVGMYKNDKRHGHGILYQPKISLVQSAGYTEGEWEDDRKVSGEFVAYRDSSSSTTSSSSSSSYSELCAIAYRKDGKSPSYFDGICRNHPRSAEKWTCIIEQMDKGKSMFYAESYCGA